MYRHTNTKLVRRSAPASPAPVPDWSKLSRNDMVQILLTDGTATSGRIDMVALERSVLWVIQDQGRGRIIVCSADEAQILVTGSGKTEDESDCAGA